MTKKTKKRICETVDEFILPARCPRCGSTDRTRKEGITDAGDMLRVQAGEVLGHPYTRIVWGYTSCKACSTRYRVRCYRNDIQRPSSSQCEEDE